jgi:peptidoglycan/xylan/chitin deacetylase (PgdA/CDA1 family)
MLKYLRVLLRRMNLNRREFIKSGAALGALLAIPGAKAFAASSGGDIAHSPFKRNQVALTFHGAGSSKIANELLTIVKKYNTPITVFAVGTWLKADSTIAKRILADGHDLGNHTMNHFQMKTLSAKKVQSEITDCANEIKKITGNSGKWFRPSGTQKSNATIRKYALQAGYNNCISYDVDSHDFQDPGSKAIIKNVLDNVKDGSIVSLHFDHQNTIDALPTIIEKITEKKLSLVTISDLLKA